MPTYRGHLNTGYFDSAFPDMGKLNETLEKADALLVVKHHPTMRFIATGNQYSNIRFADNKCDIYPFLPFTDVLITDYSSIYADYVLMEDKGVILYPFDMKEYQMSDFSLMDYEKNTPGTYAYTFAELLEMIAGKKGCAVPGMEAVRRKWWGNYKERNMETLWDKLIKI